MTDNKLRCALVFRLDATKSTSTAGFGASDYGDDGDGVAMSDLGGSSSATLLAIHDHAKDGGKGSSYGDAVGMMIGNDPPGPYPANSGTVGGFRVVQSELHQVVYGSDSEGLCVAVVTGLRYPSRVAIQMLVEMYAQFSERFSLQVLSATAQSLTKKAKPVLSSVCNKFDDLSSVDKTAQIAGKVDEVKVQMQDNIASMLQNTEQADSLAERSGQLSEQANVFRKKSTDLRKEMRCKNLKMTIILVLVVGGIMAAILIPIILRALGKK